MIKANSMQTLPKGKMPPNKVVTMEFTCQAVLCHFTSCSHLAGLISRLRGSNDIKKLVCATRGKAYRVFLIFVLNVILEYRNFN